MSSLLKYRPLFNMRLLIDYYLSEETDLFQDTVDNPMETVLERQTTNYKLEQDLLISPTKETQRLLTDKRMVFKRNNEGFIIAAQVNELLDGTFVPFSALDTPFSLKFAVYLRNPYFYNFTNLRLESDIANKDQYVYYFSNRANNVINSEFQYLSQPIPDFDITYAYEAGELFIDASNPADFHMFEAIENNGPGAFDNTNWREIFNDTDPLFQFVSNTDRIILRPSIFKVNVSSVAEERLLFLIFDINANLVTTISHLTSEIGTPLIECELDLRTLNTGQYRIEVQDALNNSLPDLGFTFFKDDSLVSKSPFAIIECFHEPDGSLDDYRWLDHTNANRLRSPEYTVRWKNRATWWRYYYETSPTFVSTMIENFDPDATAPNHRILVTTDPIALTQIGREVAINLGTGDVQLLPNPDVQMIYPEDGRIYSELNMGGGIGPPD